MMAWDYVRWRGRKANFIGTSITNGLVNYPTIGTMATRRYTDILAGILGMTINNYGVNSSTIAVKESDPTARNPIVERYTSMANGVDLVCVDAGTNDWQYDWTPLGDMSSRSKNDFYGALHVLCDGLKVKYPTAKIYFTTPIRRRQTPYDAPYAVNASGKTIKEYGDIIKEVCAYYDIPVLDLYQNLVLNPHITSQADAYVPDRTHPNDAGHKSLARAHLNFLLKLR